MICADLSLTFASLTVLEEIDLLFLTGYVENRSYVEVSLNMPKRNEAEIAAESQRLRAEYAAAKGDPEKARENVPAPGSDNA